MSTYQTTVKSFISESISVKFREAPAFLKTPSCPNSFIWREKRFVISKCLSEWKDFSRHGQMAQNMQPQHAQIASKRGSWGVGKFFFDIQTEEGHYYRIYYDRSPRNVFNRTGVWILLAELELQKE